MQDLNVSIIIPTYKRKLYMIERAIESVLNQTYKKFEIIVVDDNDESNEYYNETKKCNIKYKAYSNIRFVYHNQNRGANAARNTGIENSKYEILAFLDSDDEWDKNYLELMVEKIKPDEIGICYSGYYIITENDQIKVNCNGIEGYIFYKEILQDRISPTSCVITKKEAIMNSKGFDTSLPARQDYDMWIRICKNYNVATVKKPLVKVYRNGHESISSDYEKKVFATKAVYSKVLKMLTQEEKNKYERKVKLSEYKCITGIYVYHGIKEMADFYAKETLKFGLIDLKLALRLFFLKIKRR